MNEQNGEDLASRQAKLQKALSAAYLSHQIAELESQVKATTLTPPSDPKARNTAPAHRRGDQNENGDLHQRDPNDDLGRPDEVDDIDEEGEGEDWRAVVVDASALMWARNAVKRLVNKGWEVIVPLEALRTLDLLKKGSSPSAVAARQAARYIEHATRFHALLSSDPSITVQSGTNYKRGRGLRLQREEEVRSVDSMIDELALPPMDGEASMPPWVSKTFTCVAYFKKIMNRELDHAEDDGMDRESGPILYVGNPPVFVEVEQGRVEPAPAGRDGDRGKDADYAVRGEGHVILEEAARFDLTLEVLRDDDVEVEASGLGRNRGRNGKGQARNGERKGKGGKGRSGRGERETKREKERDNEPEREVRILLRRPTSPSPNPFSRGHNHNDSHPSPESAQSTLLTSGNGNSPAFPGPQLKLKIDPKPVGILARPPPPSPFRDMGRPPPPPPPHPHGPPHPPGVHPPPLGGMPPLGHQQPQHHPPPPPHHRHHPGPPSPQHHGHPPPPPPEHSHHRPPPPRDFTAAHGPMRPPPPPEAAGRRDTSAHPQDTASRNRGNRGKRGDGGTPAGGSGGGAGGGGRSRNDRRGAKPSPGEFVLLQRPESLVRHAAPGPEQSRNVPTPRPNPGSLARIDVPSPAPSVSHREPERNRRDEGRSRGRGGGGRLDEPKVILLQRPK